MSKDIFETNARRTGMTVPDGYFESFAAKMAASLPEQDWEKTTVDEPKRSVWQIIRPYVYMAAMFAGVWLMMNMFNHIRPAADLSIPAGSVLAEAIGDDQFIDNYFIDNTDTDDILDDVWNDDL